METVPEWLDSVDLRIVTIASIQTSGGVVLAWGSVSQEKRCWSEVKTPALSHYNCHIVTKEVNYINILPERIHSKNLQKTQLPESTEDTHNSPDLITRFLLWNKWVTGPEDLPLSNLLKIRKKETGWEEKSKPLKQISAKLSQLIELEEAELEESEEDFQNIAETVLSEKPATLAEKEPEATVLGATGGFPREVQEVLEIEIDSDDSNLFEGVDEDGNRIT